MKIWKARLAMIIVFLLVMKIIHSLISVNQKTKNILDWDNPHFYSFIFIALILSVLFEGFVRMINNKY